MRRGVRGADFARVYRWPTTAPSGPSCRLKACLWRVPAPEMGAYAVRHWATIAELVHVFASAKAKRRRFAAVSSDVRRRPALWLAGSRIHEPGRSARLNGHDPHAYLKDVMERLPAHPPAASANCCRQLAARPRITAAGPATRDHRTLTNVSPSPMRDLSTDARALGTLDWVILMAVAKELCVRTVWIALWEEIVRAARQAPRMYAAPFFGAMRQTRIVFQEIQRENRAAQVARKR